MTICELLTNARKTLGLTLEDVGNAVGVSKATVSRWESGDIHKMKRDKIAALSKVLDIDPLLLVQEPEILTNDEQHLLKLYRMANKELKDAAIRTLGGKTEVQEKDTPPSQAVS